MKFWREVSESRDGAAVWSTVVAGAIVLLLVCAVAVAEARSRVVPGERCPCGPGTFVLDRGMIVEVAQSGRADGADVALLRGMGIAINEACRDALLRCQRTRDGSRLRATWRRESSLGCGGLLGAVRITGTFDRTCSLLWGRIRVGAGPGAQRFTAHRDTAPPGDNCPAREAGGSSECTAQSFLPTTVRSASVLAALGHGGEPNLYQFTTGVADRVNLAMTRMANQPDGSSTLDPLVEILDSRGVLVAADDDSGSDTPPGPGRNALVQDLAIPAPDTYTVIARGAGGTGGGYVIQLTSVDDAQLVPAQFTPVPPVQPTFSFSGSITAAGEEDRYTFAANAETIVSIGVRRVANQPNGTSTLDPSVALLDSRGVLVASDDDTGSNGPIGPGRNALIPNLTLLSTDTYTLVVRGQNETLGPYVVDVTFGRLVLNGG